MASLSLLILPPEMIDQISQELSGMDLFHFTLVTYYYLDITNDHLIQLLSRQSSMSLIKETHALVRMSNSPYMIVEDGIGVVLSSHKWRNAVYGPFKLNVIQKSLKYFSMDLFFLYTRLWSFNPFYYEACYPTLDIFNYSYLLELRPLSLDEHRLFKVWGNNSTPPHIVMNFQQFLLNFTAQYEYDVWGTYVDWNLFVVAGGSVVLSLLTEPLLEKGSDVDLFFLKQNAELFQRAVNELEARLQNKYFVRRKTTWPNRLVQFDLYRKFTINDIFNGKSFIPSVVIQLIRPTTTSITISQILHSFDLDVCAAAFNSTQVLISFGCLQALNSGHTTCYAVPISASEFMRRVPRLYKYQQRGFNILCPKEFDIDALLSTAVEDCKEIRFERIYRFRRQHFGDNCDSFSIQKKFCEYYGLN